jgi:hypothetical protein
MLCLSRKPERIFNELTNDSKAESQSALPLRATTIFGVRVISSPNGSAACAFCSGVTGGVCAAAGGLAGDWAAGGGAGVAAGADDEAGGGVGAGVVGAGVVGAGAGDEVEGDCARLGLIRLRLMRLGSMRPGLSSRAIAAAAGTSVISARWGKRARFIQFSQSVCSAVLQNKTALCIWI